APRLPLAQFLLGRAWEIRGWDDRAGACWTRAIELDPAYAAARFRLGRLLLTRSYLARYGFPEDRDRVLAESEKLAGEAARMIESAMAGGTFDDPVQLEVARAMIAYARLDRESVARI